MYIKEATIGIGEKFREYDVYVNAYWIRISRKGKVVYRRAADGSAPWLDESHRKIANALNALEKAIEEAIS